MAALPQKIIQLQRFNAVPDTAFIIQVTETVVLLPFFRWDGVHYQDATGDYDLCLSADELYYEFISRRVASTTFAYRYIPAFWMAPRVGLKGGGFPR